MQCNEVEERSLSRAVIDDPAGCVWTTMGDGRQIVVVSHPERVKEEFVGWYVFVGEDARSAARLLLKGVMGEYGDLTRFLADAGVVVMRAWCLCEQADRLLERVTQASFFLWNG